MIVIGKKPLISGKLKFDTGGCPPFPIHELHKMLNEEKFEESLHKIEKMVIR